MRRLFRHATGGNEPWHHLMRDGALDHSLCNRLLAHYICDDEAVVFTDPRHALQCKRIDAYKHIDEFMKLGSVRSDFDQPARTSHRFVLDALSDAKPLVSARL